MGIRLELFTTGHGALGQGLLYYFIYIKIENVDRKLDGARVTYTICKAAIPVTSPKGVFK